MTDSVDSDDRIARINRAGVYARALVTALEQCDVASAKVLLEYVKGFLEPINTPPVDPLSVTSSACSAPRENLESRVERLEQELQASNGAPVIGIPDAIAKRIDDIHYRLETRITALAVDLSDLESRYNRHKHGEHPIIVDDDR